MARQTACEVSTPKFDLAGKFAGYTVVQQRAPLPTGAGDTTLVLRQRLRFAGTTRRLTQVVSCVLPDGDTGRAFLRSAFAPTPPASGVRVGDAIGVVASHFMDDLTCSTSVFDSG
jgi:hypothetical protein